MYGDLATLSICQLHLNLNIDFLYLFIDNHQ